MCIRLRPKHLMWANGIVIGIRLLDIAILLPDPYFILGHVLAIGIIFFGFSFDD